MCVRASKIQNFPKLKNLPAGSLVSQLQSLSSRKWSALFVWSIFSLFCFFYPRPIIFLRVCISLIFSLLLLLRVCFITLAFFLSLFDFFHFLWQKYPPVSVCVWSGKHFAHILSLATCSLSLYSLYCLFSWVSPPPLFFLLFSLRITEI